MTTDTCPKAASRQVTIAGKTVTVTGIAKGAGMIRPNMATMLGFVATDAVVAPALMPGLVREAADRSFNRITIDGDTSTNDSFVLIATQRAGHAPITQLESPEGALLREAVFAVSRQLAQAIVRDGEGATKFITVRIEGGKTKEECRLAAYAIAHSPLVKTAFFASDPNLGRILAAVGYAGIADLDQGLIDLFLDDVHVVVRGGRHPAYRRSAGPTRHAAERDHDPRRPAPRPRACDGLDLRSVARLRQHQRRLPQLGAYRLARPGRALLALRPHHECRRPRHDHPRHPEPTLPPRHAGAGCIGGSKLVVLGIAPTGPAPRHRRQARSFFRPGALAAAHEVASPKRTS